MGIEKMNQEMERQNRISFDVKKVKKHIQRSDTFSEECMGENLGLYKGHFRNSNGLIQAHNFTRCLGYVMVWVKSFCIRYNRLLVNAL